MSKCAILVGTLLLVFIASCVTLAEKIEVDPNTPGAAEKRVDNSTVDERLAQKITYASTDKRLHSVIQDISSATGVAIRCGNSEDDWKVRDLPLVVCANDIQLGVLLRAIADGLHLQLRATKISDITSYRIYRDKQLEKQVETYYQRLKEASLARENWEWDAWAKLGSMSDKDIKSSPEIQNDLQRENFSSAREYSKIIALAGPEVRDKVFAGEKVVLKLKDAAPPLKEHLANMYLEWWKSYRAREQKFYQEHPDLATMFPGLYEMINKPDPTDEELQSVYLEFRFVDGDRPGVTTEIQGPRSGQAPAVSIYADLLHKLIPDSSEPPRTPDMPSGDKLDGLQPSNSDMKVDGQSLYQIKLDIKKPEKEDEIVLRDAVAALAEASGFSIVCEDFESHGQYPYPYDYFFGSKELNNAISGLSSRMEWFVDGNRKLIVGQSRSWCDHHTRLVPESIINHLTGKIQGEGVELDDFVMTCGPSDNQISEWISDSRDLNCMCSFVTPIEKPFWAFYGALSAEDKAKAKSDEGLSLAKFDRSYLAELFRKTEQEFSKQSLNERLARAVGSNRELSDKVQQTMLSLIPGYMNMTQEQKQAIDMDEVAQKTLEMMPELKPLMSFPTDPDTISKLTLKIKRLDMRPYIRVYESHEGGSSTRTEFRPDGFQKHRYSMWMEGEGMETLIGTIVVDMPVFSRKREVKLWEEMQKTAKAGSQKGSKQQ